MCLCPVNINGIQYPCGKCPDCKAAQAYKYGLKGIMVGSKFTACANLTLTYRDECVPWRKYALYLVSGHYVFHPIADVVRYSDAATGEVLCADVDPSLIVEREFSFNGQSYRVRVVSDTLPVRVELDEFTSLSLDPMLDCCGDCPIRFKDTGFTYVFDFEDNTVSRKPWSEIFVDDCCTYVGSCYLQVVYQRDLQLLLKRFRERYYSICGYRPEIPYVGVSEYGPNTCRPHFHLCLFFDDVTDYDFIERDLVDEWLRLFGNVVEKKRSRTEDPAAFANFAKYVAKYGKKIDKAKHVLDMFRVLPMSHTFSSVGFRAKCNEVVRELYLAGRPQYSFFSDVSTLHRALLDACNFTYVVPSSVPLGGGQFGVVSRVKRVPYTFITDALDKDYYLKCSKLVDGKYVTYYKIVKIRSALSRVISFVSRFGGVDLLARISSECPSFKSFTIPQYLAKVVDFAKSSVPAAFSEGTYFCAEANYLASFRSYF